jgi:hypothetical protein
VPVVQKLTDAAQEEVFLLPEKTAANAGIFLLSLKLFSRVYNENI